MNARYESAKECTQSSLLIPRQPWQNSRTPAFPCTAGRQTMSTASRAPALCPAVSRQPVYPGLPRTPDEVFADRTRLCPSIPGSHKINVHANYAIAEPGEVIDRDTIEPRHFKRWVEFAKAHNCGLDFNPTFFLSPGRLPV